MASLSHHVPNKPDMPGKVTVRMAMPQLAHVLDHLVTLVEAMAMR
jgi:hypothetical protein